MNFGDVETDRCPNCRCSFKIAVVKFSFFHHTAMLFVCASCGLTRADSPNESPFATGLPFFAGKMR